MNNQIIQELLIQADEADSLGKVKKSLKEIKGALLNVEEGSEAFHKLTKAAADLKDKVEDANAAIERANPDKFNGLASAAKIAATGIQLTTGAMQLFGDQSEDVQKALLKVQAAMMFAEGLQNVKELEKDFAVLADTISKNPIFAIATVLIAIGAAAYKMYEDYKEANSEAHKLKIIAEETKKVTEQQVLVGNNELAIMNAKGASAFDIHEQEKKILAIKIKNAEAQLASANATLQELKSSNSLYESILEIEASTLRKLGFTEKAAQVEAMLAKNQKERFADAEKAQLDAQNQLDALKTESIVSDAKYNKILVDNAKKANDEKLKAQQDYNSETEKLREEERRAHTDKDLLELQDFTAKEAEKFNRGIISAEEYNKRIAEKNKEYADKKKAESEKEWNDAVAESEKQMDYYESNLDDQYELLKASNKKKADDDKKAAEKKKELNEQILTETSSLFGTLADFSKKNAKLQKGFAVGQATINTFQGVSKALASYPPPFSFIAAAAQLAAGLLQVKNILSVSETGSGSSASGGIGSAPSMDAINTPFPGTQPSTQLTEDGHRVQSQNNQAQPPTRVYVVESDITTTQNQVAVTETAMRFQ